MKKVFLISIVLILAIAVVFANQNNVIEPAPIQEAKIIPIWIGDYFTGKVYINDPVEGKFWCELQKDLSYSCNSLGGK